MFPAVSQLFAFSYVHADTCGDERHNLAYIDHAVLLHQPPTPELYMPDLSGEEDALNHQVPLLLHSTAPSHMQ